VLKPNLCVRNLLRVVLDRHVILHFAEAVEIAKNVLVLGNEVTVERANQLIRISAAAHRHSASAALILLVHCAHIILIILIRIECHSPIRIRALLCLNIHRLLSVLLLLLLLLNLLLLLCVLLLLMILCHILLMLLLLHIHRQIDGDVGSAVRIVHVLTVLIEIRIVGHGRSASASFIRVALLLIRLGVLIAAVLSVCVSVIAVIVLSTEIRGGNIAFDAVALLPAIGPAIERRIHIEHLHRFALFH